MLCDLGNQWMIPNITVFNNILKLLNNVNDYYFVMIAMNMRVIIHECSKMLKEHMQQRVNKHLTLRCKSHI